MANQFQPLTDAMESGVKDILNSLLANVSEDLDGPVRQISERLTMAARRNRPDLVEVCKDQLLLIILENQLEAEDLSANVFDTILKVGLNALVNGAVGALASARR